MTLFDLPESPPAPTCCAHSALRHKDGVCTYPGCTGSCRPPLSDPRAPGAKLSSHPLDTSRRAAMAVLPRSGTQRWRVLMSIAELPRTDDELVQIPGTGVKAGVRRAELVEGSWVQDSGERRKTRSDCDAIVWELTDLGRLKLLGE